MAQAFQRLGSEVTLIDRSSRILSRDDPAASRIVQDSMRRDGVRVLLNTVTQNIERQGRCFVSLYCNSNSSLRIGGDRSRSGALRCWTFPQNLRFRA